jgi:hypothetical protein
MLLPTVRVLPSLASAGSALFKSYPKLIYTMATSWLGVIPPPPGIEPNFQDPPNQLHANIAVHTVFLTLTTLSVAVRLYTRTVITKAAIGADDCTLL